MTGSRKWLANRGGELTRERFGAASGARLGCSMSVCGLRNDDAPGDTGIGNSSGNERRGTIKVNVNRGERERPSKRRASTFAPASLRNKISVSASRVTVNTKRTEFRNHILHVVPNERTISRKVRKLRKSIFSDDEINRSDFLYIKTISSIIDRKYRRRNNE